MGIQVSQQEFDRWVAAGIVNLDTIVRPLEALETQNAKPESKANRKKLLLPSCFVAPATWLIGVETVSEANCSKKWGSIARIGTQRRAVSACLGKHLRVLTEFAEAYHRGQPIGVKLTRLGGHKLDQWDNLPRSLKAVLDTICLICGIDDGSPLLSVEYKQEPNERKGVKIEIFKEL